jgi:hypothetical protein
LGRGNNLEGTPLNVKYYYPVAWFNHFAESKCEAWLKLGIPPSIQQPAASSVNHFDQLFDPERPSSTKSNNSIKHFDPCLDPTTSIKALQISTSIPGTSFLIGQFVQKGDDLGRIDFSKLKLFHETRKICSFFGFVFLKFIPKPRSWGIGR